MSPVASPTESVVSLDNASLRFGDRLIWRELTLTVKPGEFVAVLGPNGSGKTSLLRVLLGLTPLSTGSVQISGHAPRRGSREIGYIPQQKAFDPDLPIRGRDLVRFGLDGDRYGFSFGRSAAVEQVIREVGAADFADKPIGRLSGGEQQRLRVAQALLGDPKLLLCDEPLLSLDLSQQQVVSSLIHGRCGSGRSAVLFVTHDINPVLPMVDRVLYLVAGRWAVGTPDEVLTSKTLSKLYNAPVDVLRLRGRIVVMAAGEALHAEPGAHHAHHIENHGSHNE
jgi:zinc/manganese transport system ATP-binding protein